MTGSLCAMGRLCVARDAELCQQTRHGYEAAALEKLHGLPLLCACPCHSLPEQREPGAEG